jgi:hypothetical protein
LSLCRYRRDERFRPDKDAPYGQKGLETCQETSKTPEDGKEIRLMT